MKMFVKNLIKNIRHAEFISASQSNCKPLSLGEGTGFTLAEVLITLGIIGVVAALVLPQVITNYQKRITALRLKQAYNELNTVIDLAVSEHGSSKDWDYYEKDNLKLWVDKYIVPYLSGARSTQCNSNGYQVCDGVVGMYGLGYNVSNNNANPMGDGVVVRKQGSNLAWRFKREEWNYNTVTRICVYTNLPKRNSFAYLGKDVFWFIFDKREAVPRVRPYEQSIVGNLYYGMPGYTVDRDTLLCKNNTMYGLNCCHPSKGHGRSCAAVIMKDGWEIKDDYPWRKN